MIFVDTNIFYNFLFETELSAKARAVLESSTPLVTSFTVLNELVYITTRELAEMRYNIRTYRGLNRPSISQRECNLTNDIRKWWTNLCGGR